jgi:hypothetical protein
MKRREFRSATRRVRKCLSQGFVRPLATAVACGFRRKRIAAMMRVKNEETFLQASVESILPLVDEIVIIDNDSIDATPRIAQDLARSHPKKIRICYYHHAVARVGSENQALASASSGRKSPRLLANYYNWCIRQCRMNFVLKWDGDMVATPSLAIHMEHFRKSAYPVMWIFGANLYPDYHHLVGASMDTQQEVQRGMRAAMSVENWTSPYTDLEPRLFPRLFTSYRTDFWWCESLYTPWMRWSVSPKDCGFLHLKYCKPDPYENWSNDFATLIKKGIVPGPIVPLELRSLVDSIGAGPSV